MQLQMCPLGCLIGERICAVLKVRLSTLLTRQAAHCSICAVKHATASSRLTSDLMPSFDTAWVGACAAETASMGGCRCSRGSRHRRVRGL